MPATIALARAGGTVGEWAGALRDVFGEYRAPTGVGAVAVPARRRDASGARAGPGDRRRRPAARSGCSSASPASTATPTAPSRSRSPPATPGMEVVYQGIRLTPGRDRGRRPRRGRRRRRPLDPLRLPPRPGARDARGCCGRPGWTRPSWSAASSPTPTGRELGGHGRRPGLHTQGLTGWPRSWATSPSWPGLAARTSPQAGADDPPMRTPMQDPRLVVAVIGRAWPRSPPAPSASRPTPPVLAVVAGAAGVIAAIAGVALGAEARRSEDQLGAGRGRDPHACGASSRRSTPCSQEEASRRAAEDELGPTARRRRASAASTRSTPRPASTTSGTSRCSCSSRSPPPAVRCGPSRS